jgi:deoxyribodipyrimidine photo-lyase
VAATIVWLRRDLRLSDHAPLTDAAAAGAVVPVFIWAPEAEGDWAPGAASRWWLHQSLAALDAGLRARGSRLVLRRGPAAATLRAIAQECGASRVVWQRRYEPASVARDAAVKQTLREAGLDAQSFPGGLLLEPWQVENQSGRPFQVFTPYWRASLARLQEPAVLPVPARLTTPDRWPAGLELDALELMPRIRWYDGIAAAHSPGEAGAQARLARFVSGALDAYAATRDRPAVPGTSRLSPHLHFGEVSARQVWCATRERYSVQPPAAQPTDRPGADAERPWRGSKFLTEIGWREFAHHLLYHFPETPLAPLRPEFAAFPWNADAAALRAWQRAETGIPLVDAGMRELWVTGYLHNRVRMIVASFLVKNLRVPWQDGARWFWDTLVDADLANNTQGWQWTGGCGADAAPYFRIFNPVTQGQRFDPDGEYVKHWLPSLRNLPAAHLHAPWEAPAEVLRAAGISLGRDYPRPIVDLRASREAALAAYQTLPKG